MLSSEALRRLPKVQLHCHLEGTVRAATFRELAARHDVDLGSRATAPLQDTYAFSTFREFLLLFGEVCKTLREPQDFARMASEYAADAAAQGVVYAEAFISPSVWRHFHPGLNVRAAVAAMREAFDAARRTKAIEVALIVDLTRNFGVRRALEGVRDAIALRDLGVIAVGLGGDESNFPPGLFVEAFTAARTAGLRTVAHAGEAAGPASIRSAIDQLGAERIGHGVRAVEDPGLVAELAERRIPLEVCLTSNRRTRVVPGGVPHPLAELDARGVVCTIDADDPAIFGTTLCDEYAAAQELCGAGHALCFARYGIEASFAAESHKAVLREALAGFHADVEPVVV